MLLYILYLGVLIAARGALAKGRSPEWLGSMVGALACFWCWFMVHLHRASPGALKQEGASCVSLTGISVRPSPAPPLLVLVVVLSLDFIFGFINQLEALRNNYQMLQALMYVVYTMPRRVYEYLPLGAFMGCLIGLGALAGTSELVVMRAAGVSIRRIVWAAMKPALVVVLISLLLGEYVAPYFDRIAESERAMASGSSNGLTNGEGLWHREGPTFMHFNAVQPNGVLHGVSLFASMSTTG